MKSYSTSNIFNRRFFVKKFLAQNSMQKYCIHMSCHLHSLLFLYSICIRCSKKKEFKKRKFFPIFIQKCFMYNCTHNKLTYLMRQSTILCSFQCYEFPRFLVLNHSQSREMETVSL